MSKEKEYIKNTLILLIGKFSSQIIAFLLIPLYTHKLAASHYGYIDLLQTYISLLSPVILLQLDSAVFRHLIDIRNNKKEKSRVISSSFFCTILLLILSIIVFTIINLIIKIKFYPYIVLSMLTTIFNTYFMSISRGNGHNKTFATASILSSFTTLVVNLVLILKLGFGAESILIGTIVANIVSLIYVFIKEKIYDYVCFKLFNKKVLFNLLNYSIPMIPNVLSWWIVGLSDRTIIVNFIGTAANGIYSISCKFSNLLNSIFSIFNMSWQESASLHIDDDDASDFFSKMISNIFNLFLIISCLIIGFLPCVFNIVIGKEYLDAYNYIPILLTANLFNVLVGLFGGIYVSKKMTKKVATTTILSAIINISINLIFIKIIGLYAACISTLISYLFMVIYRYHDINKIVKIKLYDKKNIIYLIGFAFLLVNYYFKYNIVCLILCMSITLLYFKYNKNFIINIIKSKKRKNK